MQFPIFSFCFSRSHFIFSLYFIFDIMEMNFSPGLKCNFWKHAFFPIQRKSKQTPKPKFDLFIKSSFFLNLGKSYYSLSHIFWHRKIIEDKINKINDPIFKIWEKPKYENNEISNSLRGSLSCIEFLGSNQKWNKILYAMMI